MNNKVKINILKNIGSPNIMYWVGCTISGTDNLQVSEDIDSFNKLMVNAKHLHMYIDFLTTDKFKMLKNKNNAYAMIFNNPKFISFMKENNINLTEEEKTLILSSIEIKEINIPNIPELEDDDLDVLLEEDIIHPATIKPDNLETNEDLF